MQSCNISSDKRPSSKFGFSLPAISKSLESVSDNCPSSLFKSLTIEFSKSLSSISAVFSLTNISSVFCKTSLISIFLILISWLFAMFENPNAWSKSLEFILFVVFFCFGPLFLYKSPTISKSLSALTLFFVWKLFVITFEKFSSFVSKVANLIKPNSKACNGMSLNFMSFSKLTNSVINA